MHTHSTDSACPKNIVCTQCISARRIIKHCDLCAHDASVSACAALHTVFQVGHVGCAQILLQDSEANLGAVNNRYANELSCATHKAAFIMQSDL